MHTYIHSLVYHIHTYTHTHIYIYISCILFLDACVHYARKKSPQKSRFSRDFFFSARFRKRENAYMETAPMYLYATDFFARKNAAKIAYMEKRP